MIRHFKHFVFDFLALKNYPKADIKFCQSCSFLPDFLIFPEIFWTELWIFSSSLPNSGKLIYYSRILLPFRNISQKSFQNHLLFVCNFFWQVFWHFHLLFVWCFIFRYCASSFKHQKSAFRQNINTVFFNFFNDIKQLTLPVSPELLSLHKKKWISKVSNFKKTIDSRKTLYDKSGSNQIKSSLKGALSGLRKFLATENPFKMMKNAIYFTPKAFFALKIFNFLSWLDLNFLPWLVMYQNGVIKKIGLVSSFMTSQPG